MKDELCEKVVEVQRTSDRVNKERVQRKSVFMMI